MRVLSPCLAFDCGLLRTRLGDDVAVGLPIVLIVELKESGFIDEKRLATLLLRSYVELSDLVGCSLYSTMTLMYSPGCHMLSLILPFMLYETIDHNHRRLRLYDSTYMPCCTRRRGILSALGWFLLRLLLEVMC
jgi:hypothetical protein